MRATNMYMSGARSSRNFETRMPADANAPPHSGSHAPRLQPSNAMNPSATSSIAPVSGKSHAGSRRKPAPTAEKMPANDAGEALAHQPGQHFGKSAASTPGNADRSFQTRPRNLGRSSALRGSEAPTSTALSGSINSLPGADEETRQTPREQ